MGHSTPLGYYTRAMVSIVAKGSIMASEFFLLLLINYIHILTRRKQKTMCIPCIYRIYRREQCYLKSQI